VLKKILVTGCGGDIALSIARILKSERVAQSLVGCDITEKHPGRFFYDSIYVLPKVTSSDYENSLKSLVERLEPDLIVVGSEPEIRFFSEHRLHETAFGVPVICANKAAMDVGFDKLRTAEFLKELGAPSPWTVPIANAPLEIPCIVKDRTGSGSKTIAVVDDAMLVDYYRKRLPDGIWQERLLPDDQEYTCGLYGSKDGAIRHFVARRQLVGGLTGSGEVVRNHSIEQLLMTIARAVDLRGAINVQLRLTSKGPVVFEINPRFSSTVMFRHLFGFKDLIWSIQEKMGMKPDAYVDTSVGRTFFRGATEFIV
jgi:carbamoyl-phosphate synthase large subunit